jgi:hypothetical protein
VSYLKTKLRLPVVKYGVIALCSSVWVFALVDQLYTSAGTMKYLLMSLIMLTLVAI